MARWNSLGFSRGYRIATGIASLGLMVACGGSGDGTSERSSGGTSGVAGAAPAGSTGSGATGAAGGELGTAAAGGEVSMGGMAGAAAGGTGGATGGTAGSRTGGAGGTSTGGTTIATGGLEMAGAAGAAAQSGAGASLAGSAGIGDGGTGQDGAVAGAAARGGSGPSGTAGGGSPDAGGAAGAGGCVDEDQDDVFVGCDDYANRFGPDCDDNDETVGSCPPRNVILMLGDGMGFEQLKATRMFKSGASWPSSPLTFETFPASASVTTDNAQGGTTDSAAAATAMATGYKVANGVLSIVDGQDQETVLEQYAAAGKRTGLVTIVTRVVDASPAAFGAHVSSRADFAGIASDLLGSSRPNVLFGGTDDLPSQQSIESAGYFYTTLLDSIDTSAAGPSHVFGAFASHATPTLPERAQTALTILEHEPEGLFLFVETEGTDEYGHHNDLEHVIDSALEFERAVDTVLAWAAGRTDTLIVVLADHETGGLTVTETDPAVGVVPAHTYSTTGHTPTPVPLFARGPGAETVTDVMDNTDVYPLLGGT